MPRGSRVKDPAKVTAADLSYFSFRETGFQQGIYYRIVEAAVLVGPGGVGTLAGSLAAAAAGTGAAYITVGRPIE